MSNLTITGAKQSEIVRACKHLLDLARTGRVAAIGYAVVQLDDADGSFLGGSNAVWVDDHVVKDALKTTIQTLKERVAIKTGEILQ